MWDEEFNRQEFSIPLLDEVTLKSALCDYPKMEPYLRVALKCEERINDSKFAHDLGLPPSYKYRALAHLVDTCVKQETVQKIFRQSLILCVHPRNLSISTALVTPWLHPGAPPEAFKLMRRMYVGERAVFRRLTREYWEMPHHVDKLLRNQFTEGKYRFSAAAAALSFFKVFPWELHQYLRRIVLHENAVSVARPECHGLGFIPLCQLNPQLRIERRVDIWRTVFQTINDESPSLFFSHERQWLDTPNLDGTPTRRPRNYYRDDQPLPPGLPSHLATHRLGLWIMEALELKDSGMPPGSFKLVLDGGPVSDQCSEIFRTRVQRGAVWQEAYTRILDKTAPEERDWFQERRAPCYYFDGFPEAILDLANQRCDIVECSFNTGPSMWDVEQELSRFRLSKKSFVDWFAEQETILHPDPPLPKWRDLLAENILPQFFDHDYAQTPIYHTADL
ncbi:hypothetical protein B0I35DRAFT_64098 [Stachybotrys elegans]|uniref:Uncharacterized protein n=1 Tax=Stachybotrys elegans TaxID=80388 RepID=A0A8K0WMT1_9HYPO|nr:hypothetical protein B0I35DRAFT_64098 [Stachybotrys elegans]